MIVTDSDAFYKDKFIKAVEEKDVENFCKLLDSGKECLFSVIGRAASIALEKERTSEGVDRIDYRTMLNELISPKSIFTMVRNYHQQQTGRAAIEKILTEMGVPLENQEALPV